MALMPVAEALEKIQAGVMPLGPEHVGLRFAAGRTLAQDLSAALTHPPFDSSSMDGYALRTADAVKPNASLRVIGEAAAGRSFAGTVGPGDAVRIFTGAPLPGGADTIVIQEDVQAGGGRVTISSAPVSGNNIRPRGQDFHAGPRKKIYFDPSRTRAGVVTCGGLCPGFNDVIRALVMELTFRYGVKRIHGFCNGFEGFIARHGRDVLDLTQIGRAHV